MVEKYLKTTYPYTTGSLEGQTGETVAYSYGDSEWKDLLTAYNGQEITYDAIGNPLNYKNGFTFTWQNGRRLATAAANGKALSFAYNESGIRTQKTVDGVATEYYLDGSTVLAQKTGNNTVWYYYDCNGTREALEYGGQVYYYLYNAQGDVMALYDNDLNIVTEYTYDSWGKLLSVTGSLAETVGKANPFRYRGYYYDTETELYYLNSRYYDPEIGRFINADGYVSTGQGVLGNNMFTYCGNNPIIKFDFTGNGWLLATLIVVAATVLIAHVVAIKKINNSAANPVEKKLAKKDYFAAYKVDKSRKIADKYTDKYYGKGAHKADNNQANAFRHAMWSAVMTDKIGKKKARKFATAHEMVKNFKEWQENCEMDLFNNALGRQIAEENEGKGYDVFAEKIHEAINDGKAVVIEWDSNLD